jgi:ferredoxin-fold anticodon binding domain-containing protein
MSDNVIKEVKIVDRLLDIPFDDLEDGYYFEKNTGLTFRATLSYDRNDEPMVEFEVINLDNVKMLLEEVSGE